MTPDLPNSAGTMSDDGPARILIVDDEPLNHELIHAYLPPHYKPLDAMNGPDALEIIAREPVDLVLLDVMMPGISGMEVCQRIKAWRPQPFLPVLLLTALSDQESRNRGLEAGADDFLSKPVD